MEGHRSTPSGFGNVPFEQWLTTVASELTENLAGRHHYEPASPGAVSEAAAYLLSGEGLAPDEDGYPALSGQGGLSRTDEFEMLAVILYSAAFLEEQQMDPDLCIYIRLDSGFAPTQPREERRITHAISAAAVLVWREDEGREDPKDRERSTLVMHEKSLELSEVSCRSREDLLRLYQRITRAAV